jgi:hypothetical protein
VLCSETAVLKMLAPSCEIQWLAAGRVAIFSGIGASGQRKPVTFTGRESGPNNVRCETPLLKLKRDTLWAVAACCPGTHVDFHVPFVALQVALGEFVEHPTDLGSIVSARLKLALQLLARVLATR